ncbi:MAG: flagellar biosynthesis protein FlhF [Pseudomonadota bacterium]
MNVQRFTGKNAREAIAKVRATLGEHAVVLSNRPIPSGVEILAIPGTDVPDASAAPTTPSVARAVVTRSKVEPMSTVSFETFVRERQKQQVTAPESEAPVSPQRAAMANAPRAPQQPGRFAAETLAATATTPTPIATVPSLPEKGPASVASPAAFDANQVLMEELKSMRSMIASQLSSLSWFDTVRRSPVQTQLLRLMLGNGFSPALARHMVNRLPADRSDAEADASQWLKDVISHNLHCIPEQESILNAGGVFALVGPTGVGKTTTTAKIAAGFALKHGAGSVGLITMDTYRMAASDQLRAFGRLLNIPVHTARDAASLADLLELFDKKQLVLIDTVGASQRDQRLAELFAALPSNKVTRLLVLNAAAQAETLDEVVQTYGHGPGTRCVITKLDEAVKTGGAVDVVVRRHLLVEGIANGQRVPEDWHSARPQLLAQKALQTRPSSVFTTDDSELGLVMTAPEIAWMNAGMTESRHA